MLAHNGLRVDDVQKNFRVPVAAANFFDDLTERLVNQKGHGVVFTACLLAFAALEDDEQKRILGSAMHLKGDILKLPDAIDQTIGTAGHLKARKITKRGTK